MSNRSYRFQAFLKLAGLLTAASLLLAACQPAAQTPTAAPTSTAVPTAMPAATDTPAATQTPALSEPTIKVADDPKLGKILVDDKGMTLYAYTKDSADTSTCTGKCIESWPPLLSAGSPKAGDGLDPTKLGTTKMGDGRLIVTYNHMPLYNWIKDAKPGDTTGQNVGKVWFVVGPDGNMVKDVPAADASTPAAAATSEASIKVVDDPMLGKILVDDKGMTLYAYTKDTADTSTCTGKCSESWPPLLSAGSPKGGDGVDASKLGTAKMGDGRLIVTYNHMPLYYWIKDAKPGDTTGQNVGKVWFVVNPGGMMVK